MVSIRMGLLGVTNIVSMRVVMVFVDLIFSHCDILANLSNFIDALFHRLPLTSIQYFHLQFLLQTNFFASNVGCGMGLTLYCHLTCFIGHL